MTCYWAPPVQPREQAMLYPQYLDEIVGPDHPIRDVLAVLEAVDWTPFERHYDQTKGQPPIHPMLIAGCILYGLTRGIASSRTLEDATRNRIDFIWFLEERTIDHTTFANFRKRFGSEIIALRNLIEINVPGSRKNGTVHALVPRLVQSRFLLSFLNESKELA